MPSSAQQRRTLPTKVSALPSERPTGRLTGSQRMNLALTLRLPNPEGLQQFLQQLYDPTSPKYRQSLSVEQFTEQFGPTQDDYQKVIDFATSHGLTVTNRAPNRLVLDVSGAVADIEKAFQVKMQTYQHPTEKRSYYAPDQEPSVEAEVPIQGISGLNNFQPPRPMGLKYAQKSDLAHSNQTGSGPNGFFLGSDMRAAYAPGSTLTGAGQAVGLFDFGPYNLSDVQAYFKFINQPLNVPIVNVLLDGVSPVCGAGCDDGEEVIDIQQAISMAPGLSAVIVYEGNNDTDMFNQMATDNIAKQLSCSFGFLPADPSSDESIFQEFAAQGQNLFVASGDGGAYFGAPANCANFSNLNGCIFYPADDPFITAAGGTDLTTNGPGGTWQSETGWIGSGGGFSTNGLPIPSYQVPVITAANQGSTTLRNIPDVAAEANTDNFFCANGGCFIGVGGTSLSAPRWAGFLALANEQANGAPIGFLNPTIYALGQSANYNSDFHDIITGNNFNSGSPAMFSDITGFDLVTGWGSPNGSGLLNALGLAATGPNFSLAASPATLDISQGQSKITSIILTPVDGFTGTVNLTATVLGQPTGVTAILSQSTATPSGPAPTLTVSTTSSTPGGNFQIVVTGTAGGLTHTTYITLALPGFTIQTPGSVFLNQGSTTSAAITIVPVNGFAGTVALSVTGLPEGVRGFFKPEQTATASNLEFAALILTQTGPFSLTVTGKSANIVQTATVTLEVSAALGSRGFGTPVDLSPSYNVAGVYTDGSAFGAGLDGGGAAYSANLLTPSRVLDLIDFRFGPANLPDAVSATGLPIALPEHRSGALLLLATGVQGSQTETVTINYADGTSSVFQQNFSDWFSPQNFPNETVAVAMQHRDISDGSQDDRTFNLYAYKFDLNRSKAVKSFTLSTNRDVVVLAVTLVE
ncbi:MAG TPA: S53 family peptidase [Candidatus Acidoferrum sp.]|jgi:subtilase family serine protease